MIKHEIELHWCTFQKLELTRHTDFQYLENNLRCVLRWHLNNLIWIANDRILNELFVNWCACCISITLFCCSKISSYWDFFNFSTICYHSSWYSQVVGAGGLSLNSFKLFQFWNQTSFHLINQHTLYILCHNWDFGDILLTWISVVWKSKCGCRANLFAVW